MTKYELFYFVQFQKRFSQEPIGISKNVTHFVSLLSAEWCSSVCLAVCGNVEVCNSVKQMAANWWFKACTHLTLWKLLLFSKSILLGLTMICIFLWFLLIKVARVEQFLFWIHLILLTVTLTGCFSSKLKCFFSK